MKNKLILIVCILLLSSTIIYAFSKDDAVSWLKNNVNWAEMSTEEIVYASLALKNAKESSKANEGISVLTSRMSQEGCFPSGNCKIKDTALALLALNEFNKPTDKTLQWIYDAQKPALGGTWWIQVATNSNGTCDIKFDTGNVTRTITKNNIQECNTPWMDVTSCLGNNLDKKSEEIEVNCNLDFTPVISLIYNVGNSYYIIQEKRAKDTTLIIENGCWPETKNLASCDYLTTAYTSWVLEEINKDSNSAAYLKSQLKEDLVENYALAYLSTNNKAFQTQLKSKQRVSGSFDNDVFKTSIAGYALKDTKNFVNITSWLSTEQKQDGSLDGVLKTASALYFVFLEKTKTEKPVEGYCGDGICDSPAEDIISCSADCLRGESICGNNITEVGEDCDGTADANCIGKCSNDCECPEEKILKELNCDDGLDDDEDGYIDCDDSDCSLDSACRKDIAKNELNCDDGLDDDEDGYIDCDDSDCEEFEGCKKGFPLFWVFLILILIILLFIGFLFYNQKKGKKPDFDSFKKLFKKKKKEGFEFKTEIPITPSREFPSREAPFKPRSKVEEELERSLEEAKKLIGKK